MSGRFVMGDLKKKEPLTSFLSPQGRGGKDMLIPSLRVKRSNLSFSSSPHPPISKAEAEGEGRACPELVEGVRGKCSGMGKDAGFTLV